MMAFICIPYISIHIMSKIRYLFVMAFAMALITTISIKTISMPQAAFANKDNRNPSSAEDCGPDKLPASIDGSIRCMGQGECYSEKFKSDGMKVKHCNFMMSPE